MRMADLFFFTVFTIAIILNFIKSYKNEGESTPTKDHAKIANRYFKGNFGVHFITWLPFHWIIDFEASRSLYGLFLIKCIRMW